MSPLIFRIWGGCREERLQAIFIVLQSINTYTFVYSIFSSSRKHYKSHHQVFVLIFAIWIFYKDLALKPLHSNMHVIKLVRKGTNKYLNAAYTFFFIPSLTGFLQISDTVQLASLWERNLCKKKKKMMAVIHYLIRYVTSVTFWQTFL